MIGPALVLGLRLVLAPPTDPSEARADAAAPDDDDADDDAPGGAEPGSRRGPAYVDVLETLPEGQRDEDGARALITSGKAAFRDERFEEAIDFFAEAYRMFPNMTLLYALGSAHRRAYESSGGTVHRRLSIRRYQQYLSSAPDAEFASFAQNYLTALLAERDLGDLELEAVTRILVSTTIEDATMTIDGGGELSAPGVVSVEPGEHAIVVRAPGYRALERSFDVPEGATYQVQAELEGLPGRVEVSGPKRAIVRVDGRVIGKLPEHAPLELELEAGEHVVVVTKNGRRPFTQDLSLARDGRARVRAKLEASNQRLTSYFFMGLGGVGVITTAVLTGLTLDRQIRALDLAEQREAGQLSTDEFERYLALALERDRLRAGAVLAGVAGAALTVTGLALFAYDIPRLDGAGTVARLRASPQLGPGHGGLTATLQF